jgi:hypothetical protein
MHQPRLRVFFGPETKDVTTIESERRNRVTVELSDLFPLLADAVQSERTWLRDFADDEITISSDLYEVLLAYQHYRRPSA